VDTLSYKTVSANAATVNKQWVLVDAEGQTLGRLASRIAKVMRGKHKPNFTPHVDGGDFVIVINAEKVSLSGQKWDQKEHIRHTGYPGGQRSLTSRELFEKDPILLIESAVKGMLPKNRLGRKIYKNMHVYVGAEHPHEAQKPEVINFNEIKF
jgi:large subunit ribosomal protein L13